MPRHCKVCNSPFRAKIEEQASNGIPARVISNWLHTNCGVTICYTAVQRHIKEHTNIGKGVGRKRIAPKTKAITPSTNETQLSDTEVKQMSSDYEKYKKWKELEAAWKTEEATEAEVAAGLLANDAEAKRAKKLGEDAVKAIERSAANNRINEEAVRALARIEKTIVAQLMAKKE